MRPSVRTSPEGTKHCLEQWLGGGPQSRWERDLGDLGLNQLCSSVSSSGDKEDEGTACTRSRERNGSPRRGEPHPPSRSGTTGSRSRRSRPPGTAAWCSPSAGICAPAGSETTPAGRGGQRWHHGQRAASVALSPRQGQGQGQSAGGRQYPEEKELYCSSRPGAQAQPGSEQELSNRFPLAGLPLQLP